MVTGLGISMISQATAGKKFWIKPWKICFDTMLDIGLLCSVEQKNYPISKVFRSELVKL